MPLYAVETVRMLVSEGRLEAVGDGTHRASGPLETIDVPASLQALIAARLDALVPADRGLVQDASVLGQTFAVAALAAITGDATEALEPRLRRLVSRDLLSLDTDPRSPERGQYGFVQALIREVAYGTLSKRDRRARHLAAARYFESLDDEELAGALAMHYLAAYEAAAEGPEGAALAGQARIALRAAADRARGLGSHEQAIAFLENAARLPGDMAEQLALMERAADIALESSRYARASTFYSEVMERAREAGDRATAARLTASLAEATFQLNPDAGVTLAEQAIVEYDDLDQDAIGSLRLRLFLARAAIRRGHNREAADGVERIATAIEHTRDEALILTALITRGAALTAVGRPVEGIVILEGAIRRARSSNLPALENRARINLSVLLADDDVRAARDLAVAGFTDAVSKGQRSDAAFFALNATEYDLHLGEIAAGKERVGTVLGLDLEGADRVINLSTLHGLLSLSGESNSDLETEIQGHDLTSEQQADWRTWAALVAGDHEGVMRHGLELARDDELNAPMGYLRAAIGAAMAGDAATARAAADELAAIQRWGRWVEACADATMALALALEGTHEGAITLGRRAAEAFRTDGVRFDEGLVLFGLGLALRPTDPAAEYLARAGDIFEAVGAHAMANLTRRLGGRDRATAAGGQRQVDEVEAVPG